MATTYYDAEDCYTVTADSYPLEVDVRIGEGQGGGYLIFNGTKLIGANTKAALQSIDSSDLWLTVAATVKDKLKETNWTSVTVYLKDASKSKPVAFGPYKREVDTHLDTVSYTVKLKIIKP